jgi:hypothetical protein
MSPGTAANCRRCIDLKIKPALGALAVSRLDTATLDRFYAELRTGLEQLPPVGARFTAVPPPVAGFTTFPVRSFAMVPE